MTNPPLKLLTWDIETGAGVNGFKSNLSVALTIGYKWAHEKKARCLSVLDYGDLKEKKIQDWDTEMLREFHEIMCEADATITHYGTRFDKKYLTGRMVIKGLPPFPPIKHYDTWQMAKTIMVMDSNRLGNLTKNLDLVNQKQSNGWPHWWMEVGRSPHTEVKKMIPYCIGDVMATEELFFRLLPYMKGGGREHIINDDRPTCTKCGSDKLQKRGRHVTTTGIFQRFQCQNCGSWSRDATKLSTSKYIRNME